MEEKLASWVFGGPMNTGVLAISLNGAHYERYKRWKRRRIAQRPVHPDFLPVNLALVNGHMSNVLVYLRYGFNLEFTVKFYNRLVLVVVGNIMLKRYYEACVSKIQNKPNKRRFFLILLVVHTYFEAEISPNEYQGCDEALQAIWNHNPSSFLCRDEFLEVFEPYSNDTTHSFLKRFYERYCARVSMSPDVVQPFSLAHHCRCKVRDMMGTNTLPHGVQDLPIPDKVKRYLWFQ